MNAALPKPSALRGSPSEVLVECIGLSKSFRDGKEVLRGLDLQVPRGTVLGLIGKNGAGKSTLLKCMLGLLRTSGGAIHVMGDDAWNLSAETKARVAYVPQTISLHPWMKVQHIIPYTAAFYPTWNDVLVADLCERWELPMHDRLGTLSVGQLQRVAIVLALGHEPELLILDEPAASLDPVARREFLRQVLNIAAEADRTVLFSTHITSDIERVADSVAILKSGQIAFHGGLDELKDSVKRLHFTAANSLPSAFSVPGALSVQVDGSRAVVAVRDARPELIDELRRQWNAEIEVEDLNLEDIFLALHQVRA